ncbi:hypothetical protein tb265_06510 [Gemmatimonadetes bacterium T265]|nr:hypothetical protein tb265_06510 [Gemmatimonadetes bacterium T265]
MALRAELAARTGQQPAARRWSRAVLDLWGGGDRPLSELLDRMRQLAAAADHPARPARVVTHYHSHGGMVND